MTISVKNTCVRIKLTIGKQSAYITDKEATSNAEQQSNTHGIVKITKRLFKDNKEFKKIQTCVNDVYQKTYIAETLPWDAAYRICTAKEIFNTMNKINEKIDLANQAVENFVANYSDHVANDILKSNGLLKPEFYPSVDEFKDNFYFKIDLAPVSDAADFRNIEGMTPEEIEKIEENAREGERATIMNALKDARNRLYKVVFHMQERLQEYKGAEGERLHKSVLTNVEDCITVLRKLNITNDQELNDVMDELEASVVGRDIERLKVFPKERQEIVDKVKEISEKMAWMGGNNA